MSRIVVRASWIREDAAARALLTPADLEHAARRRDPLPVLTGRALLRRVVGTVIGENPASVAIERWCPTCGRPGHGRPRVAGRNDIHVSSAHDDTVALVAVTTLAPVGVDVQGHSATAFDGFDAVALADEERLPGARLAAMDRPAARARTWTRKEAILKAVGYGLRVDPREVLVTAPTEAPAVLAWRSALPRPEPVTLHDVPLGIDSHAAAVAVLAPGPVELDVAWVE